MLLVKNIHICKHIPQKHPKYAHPKYALTKACKVIRWNTVFFLFKNLSVALNFQTGGEEMQLLHGRFLDNGNSGYVLKPKCFNFGKLSIFTLKQILFCICIQ